MLIFGSKNLTMAESDSLGMPSLPQIKQRIENTTNF